jgi:threonine synthase
LLARYAIESGHTPALAEVMARRTGQFRLPELLPLASGAATPTLGEGGTALLHTPRLLAEVTNPAGVILLIKDEGRNPTGSFKARGMAVAIARAVELGARAFCLPSAGNAGGAAAAYGALHGVEVHVAVPRATPPAIAAECRAHGAEVVEVDGTIADAGRLTTRWAAEHGWFHLATLREPWRVEGKKMMGFELLWDLGRLPDVILYPTGGGTGLVGMLKAFDEMQALGWIGGARPRMVCVQVAGCAPIVRAFHAGADHAETWADPAPTEAFGLRVPGALGDRLMLAGLRRTGGTAVAVSETDLLGGALRLAREAGVWASPEGGACVAAARQLIASGWIRHGETAVIFNTGSALKYR